MQTLSPTPGQNLHCNMILRGRALFKLETLSASQHDHHIANSSTLRAGTAR